MKRKNRRMTAEEKRTAEWRFVGQYNIDNRLWVLQRDVKTGRKRYVSQSQAGRNVIRYGSIN